MLDGLIRLYFGDRRMGKTTLAVKHALERTRPHRRGLAVAWTPTPRKPPGERDPFDGFTETTLAAVGRLPPTVRAVVFRQDDAEAVARWAIRCAGSELTPRGLVRVAGESFGPVVLLVDEADEPLPGPAGPPKGSALWYLLHRNRHVPIDVEIVTQWPAELAPGARKSRDEIYIFRLVDDLNREWVRKQWGAKAANDVPFLPPHVFRTVTDLSRPAGWVRMYPEPAGER